MQLKFTLSASPLNLVRDKDYLAIHEIEPVHSISPSLNTTSTGTLSPYVLPCARISLPDDIALAITTFASVTLSIENSFFDRLGTVTNRIPNLKRDKDYGCTKAMHPIAIPVSAGRFDATATFTLMPSVFTVEICTLV